jgi:Bacterial archaeo-eukaryotic release factor family 2
VDLGFLRPLYENQSRWPGDGYVSVYLDTSPTENAANEVWLRWRSARERLAAAGADEATLDAAQQGATERSPGKGRAVFAGGGALRFIGIMPQPPSAEISSYTPLPHVVPWLAQRPPRLSHVRVAADRSGGRVLAVPGAAGSGPVTTPDEETATAAIGVTEVAGDSWPVHKVSSGGWSQPRLQRSAEEAWAETAKRIAEAVALAASRVKAEFVVVGGDVRERSLVLDYLPVVLRDTAVLVDREVDVEAPAFDEAVWAEASWRAALEASARLDEFRARMAEPPGARRAVEGLAGTLTALRDGVVSDLLLASDPAGTARATAWTGPGLTDVAAEKEQLTERGVTEPVTDRADAALARAATGTGAQLHFLPADSGEAAPDAPDAPAVAAGWVGALLRAPSASLA